MENNNNYALDKALNVQASDIIGSLFEVNETVFFRVISNKKGDPFQGQTYQCRRTDFIDTEPELIRHNQQGHDIFLVMNLGGDTDDSITRINAQFVKMSTGTLEEQKAKICAFSLKPSLVIRIETSLIVCFFTDDTAQVSRFHLIQTALAKQFDGDTDCEGEATGLPLPNFYNSETGTPVMVEVVYFHPEDKYSQDELASVLPEVEDEPPPPKKSGTEKGLKMVKRRCPFLEYCQDHPAEVPDSLWYAMLTNLAHFKGGTDLIHELSEQRPGYTEAETQRKINQILDNDTQPVNCKTICEDDGFLCQFYTGGKCSANSPAALSHYPMPEDALRNILKGITKTGDTVKDVQAVENFIEDYMYNQKEAITYAFNICVH